MKILFFGELCPDIVHGVSVANRLNVNILSALVEVDVVQEKTRVDAVGKANFRKIITIFLSILDVFKKTWKQRYDAFYLVISLSLFGMIKTFFMIYVFSLNSKNDIVLHLHRGDFASFYERRLLHRVLIKYCFRRIAKLIVLSERQREEMKSYIASESIFVVENTVLEEASLPELSSKSVFKNKFIYISNYLKEKGVFDLLEAFSLLKSTDPLLGNAKLDCYGAFYDNELELKSRENESVKVNSIINSDAKFVVINDADALILPSWNEGQPIIILEAMLVGTPILTTKVGLIEELLGERYPFYFEPNNPGNLADCIKRFQAYEYKKELSEELRKRYYDFYSQSSHKSKLLNVFGLGELDE